MSSSLRLNRTTQPKPESPTFLTFLRTIPDSVTCQGPSQPSRCQPTSPPLPQARPSSMRPDKHRPKHEACELRRCRQVPPTSIQATPDPLAAAHNCQGHPCLLP